VLKVNVLLSESSELGQAVKLIAARTAELTNGEIEIQPFFSGGLGTNISVIMQSLAAGDMDGFIESGNYFGSIEKRFNVLDAPYAFRSREQFRNFLNSAEFQSMAGAVEDFGIKIVNSDKMNYFRAEDRAVLTKSPVFTPDDLSKLTIRQYQAEMPIRGLQALGANVQVVPWGDVYMALTTGVIDGLETVLSQSIANKHVETAKYHTILSLYFQTAYVMFSDQKWDKLTDSQRDAISTAVTEGGDLYTKLSANLRDSAIEDGRRNHGVAVIFPPLAPFQERMGPAHEEWIASGLLPKETMEFIKTLAY
jgi:TRAP-type C4-dicarboxylate transport system substrate-binding protein